MTESHPHEHGIQPAQDGVRHAPAAPAGAAAMFAEEEWQQFQRSDLGAGKVVVALMTAIFTIGLILYATIAYIVSLS